MLNKIISDEFERINRNKLSEEIEASGKRVDELAKKVYFLDKELFDQLASEILSDVCLNSEYFFINGFKAGLQLANEINNIEVK